MQKLTLILVFGTFACSDGSGGVDSGGGGDFGVMDGGADFGGADFGVDDDTPDASADAAGACSRRGLDGEVAWTSTGAFRGDDSAAVLAFRGIPFAQPPVGELRFRPTAPAECMDEERPAVAWPPICPQSNEDGAAGQEDCLYLNVWTPHTSAVDRPVMLFIHGGGNVGGSSSLERGGQRLFDGALLAQEQDVVVVTIQYRLGPLGFMAHPALAAESPQAASGNYGTLDQIEALRWVRQNAAVFGGDPERVMIFGESAGGRNVCVLLNSPLASGLFQRALMQSGFCGEASEEEALEQGMNIAQDVGCEDGDVACLRGIPVETWALYADAPVGEGLVGSDFRVNVDGWVLPADPLTRMRAGEHNRVPFVVGSNADETAAQGIPRELTEPQYRARVQAAVGANATRVLDLYDADDFESPFHAYVAVTTDAQYTCPARRIARAAHAGGSESVHRYFFSHSLSPRLGAFHGAELAYIFGALSGLTFATPPAEELAESMRGLWAAFAASGDPSPEWPAHSADDPYLRLDTPITAETELYAQKCDLWDEVSGGD